MVKPRIVKIISFILFIFVIILTLQSFPSIQIVSSIRYIGVFRSEPAYAFVNKIPYLFPLAFAGIVSPVLALWSFLKIRTGTREGFRSGFIALLAIIPVQIIITYIVTYLIAPIFKITN